MKWYIEVWKKYATFTGRARRTEYWMFVLFNCIVSILLGFIDGFLGTRALEMIYSLAIIIPSLAVGFRRLHDTGRSGWWLLLSFIPVIGWIALFVFSVQDSQPGDNQYGPNPKALIV